MPNPDLTGLKEAATAALTYDRGEWFKASDLRDTADPDDAAFIALANPATILSLIEQLAEAREALEAGAVIAESYSELLRAQGHNAMADQLTAFANMADRALPSHNGEGT